MRAWIKDHGSPAFFARVVMAIACATVVCLIVFVFDGYGGDNLVAHEGYHVESPFRGETLVVSRVTPLSEFTGLRESMSPASIETMAMMYMRRNPGVTIEIVAPFEFLEGTGLEFFQYREDIVLQLMSGTAPTLFEATALPWFDPRVNQYLADWYPLMQQDSYFNEYDFYTNVFTAISSNAQGRLVVYPYSFDSTMVMANTAISGIIDAVGLYDSLSLSEMHRLYHLYAVDIAIALYPMHSTLDAVMFSLGDFIDFGSGAIDFINHDFIQLITPSRYLAEYGSGVGAAPRWGLPEEESGLSINYLFNMASTLVFRHILGLDPVLFGNPLPKVNNDGEMLITPDFMFGLCANASPVQLSLAYDFIMFMQQYCDPLLPPSVPVYRPMLREYVEYRMWGALLRSFQHGWGGYAGGFEGACDTVISVLDGWFFNMPMAPLFVTSPIGNQMDSIIAEVILDFDNHIITGLQAAEYLQNRVSLHLKD